jgi:hypothetical protein
LLLTTTVAAGGWLWQRWQERTSVRVAIVAEVLALRKIAVERDYLSGLIEMGNQLRAIPEDQRPATSLQVRNPEHHCRVYVANDQRMKNVNTHQAAVQPHLLACLYNKLNTFQAVADYLNSKGLRTARGSELTPTAVRRLMLAFNVSF